MPRSSHKAYRIITGSITLLNVSASEHSVLRLQDPHARFTADQILHHPWMRENGTASDQPLDNVILSRMRAFAGMNKLKKEALRIIATGISAEEIAGLRAIFQVPSPCCCLVSQQACGPALCLLLCRQTSAAQSLLRAQLAPWPWPEQCLTSMHRFACNRGHYLTWGVDLDRLSLLVLVGLQASDTDLLAVN